MISHLLREIPGIDVMSKSRRGTVIWLAMLGIAVALIVLASTSATSAISPVLAFVVLIAYLGLVTGSLVNVSLSSLRLSMPRVAAATRVTPAARKAVQRARARSGYSSDATLTDVGLIVNERLSNGQLDRHIAQAVSLDNDAIQPYVTIHALPENSDRLALIQFEIFDHAGQPRFSRQCEQWLRDGENLVVCDRQLPLDVQDNVRSGVWDLQVKVDGAVAAVHSFSITPSTAEQRRRFSNDGEMQPRDHSIPDEDLPISLEDLLREQRQNSQSNSSSNSRR